MSCNGCRVLRKGCSDNCMLRHCLQWIENPQAQAHATVFVAKFFGRAGLMTFISSVPQDQRPALFQSLLYEAVGRTVNPVNGAVGLLRTGNWQVCQSAVDTVLNGGAVGPHAESAGGRGEHAARGLDYNAAAAVRFSGRQRSGSRPKRRPANKEEDEGEEGVEDGYSVSPDLNLRLVAKRRASSEEDYSETTTLGSSSSADNLESSNNNFAGSDSRKILRLFI